MWLLLEVNRRGDDVNALVIYDSEFGNTERIARAIAEGLGERYAVRAAPVSEAIQPMSETLDLLVVGGPTQKHGMSPNLHEFLDGLSRRSLRGVRAATFDTRYRMSRLLSGSAARQAAGRLRRAGCHLVSEPESFFMERDVPPQGEKRRHGMEQLEPGEVERAREWARGLAATAERGDRPKES